MTTDPAPRPHAGLLVANLWGGPRERGEQHGELFGEHVRSSGIVDFYHGYCARHLPRRRLLGRLGVRLLHSLVAGRFSPAAKQLIAGFSRAAGLDPGRVARGAVMPDVLNYLVGFSGKLTALPTVGCTSAVAWGDYTEDGSFIFARNLDFPGMGYFDRHPVVCRQRPDDGIPYVSLGTAGGVVDGITGINASGVIVALHQHISRDVAILAGGRPILDLGREVLQSARTIDEAVGIAGRWKTTSAWTLLLGSHKERSACAVEKTPGGAAAVRGGTGKFVRANDFATPALHSREIDYRPWRESSRLRVARADQFLEEHKGRLGPGLMAGLLSDRLDCERGVVRSFAQSIGQLHNMTSVVFEPAKGLLWVSESRAPAHQGPYRRLSLWDESPLGETLEGVGPGLEEHRQEALKVYIRAYVDWQERRSPAEMVGPLHDAIESDPEEPVYRYLFGFFALRAGHVESALESFAAGAAMTDIPHRTAAQRLWQARCLDLLGRRDEAVGLYGDLAKRDDLCRGLRQAAVGGMVRPYGRRSLDKVSPDFLYGDVLSY
ncbi:MAG: hypothetical protein HY927_11050 [Elusimicrobia bacterium]|nr:hypothetical protein [Elusimicrobiota bacterium]